MIIDHSTLIQLGILGHHGAESNIYEKLNTCVTTGGSNRLKSRFHNPISNLEKLKSTQQTVKKLGQIDASWKSRINNGMIFVVEKYMQSSVNFNSQGDWYHSIFIPVIYKSNFETLKFSVEQLQLFVREYYLLLQDCRALDLEDELQSEITNALAIIENNKLLKNLTNYQIKLSNSDILNYDYHLHRDLKNKTRKLIDSFYEFDMWYALSQVGSLEGFHYPLVLDRQSNSLQIENFFHPLIDHPITYSMDFRNGHFVFITGANMSGKSTLIRALGVAVYLAHLGVAVPASSMSVSVLDGLSCSIQVEDNLTQGESFFYSEVKRINEIIHQIAYNQKWMVLMDELFKGTNFNDALSCTKSIVEGLSQYQDCFFVLSTHLYQLSDELDGVSNLQFQYLETTYDAEGNYHFTYKLKSGVSKDTIGFQILKKSGVLDQLKTRNHQVPRQ